jgi:hypothetical protein
MDTAAAILLTMVVGALTSYSEAKAGASLAPKQRACHQQTRRPAVKLSARTEKE